MLSAKVLKKYTIEDGSLKIASGYSIETADFTKIKIKVKAITPDIVATIVQNTVLMWLGKNLKRVLLCKGPSNIKI